MKEAIVPVGKCHCWSKTCHTLSQNHEDLIKAIDIQLRPAIFGQSHGSLVNAIESQSRLLSFSQSCCDLVKAAVIWSKLLLFVEAVDESIDLWSKSVEKS